MVLIRARERLRAPKNNQTRTSSMINLFVFDFEVIKIEIGYNNLAMELLMEHWKKYSLQSSKTFNAYFLSYKLTFH